MRTHFHTFAALRLCVLAWITATALGADSITPGTLTLHPTLWNIGCIATYTGDDNGNATFTAQYKKSSQPVWRECYVHEDLIDRLAVRCGINNVANQFQARWKVFGLEPGTSYDVRITWTDADGGSAMVSGSVTTLVYSASVPTNGVLRYVSATGGAEGNGSIGNWWVTVTNALAQCNVGDTILVTNGSYVPFTWTKNGTPSAYIVVKGIGRPVIAGGAVAQNITIAASNIVFQGFALGTAQTYGIVGDPEARWVYIVDTWITNFGSVEVSGNAGIRLANGRTNWFVLDTRITGFDASPVETTYGIYWGVSPPGHTILVQSNFIRDVYDGIGGGGNYGERNGVFNSEVLGCVMTNCWDDGIEADGDGILCVNMGNVIRSSGTTVPHSGISMAPIYVGPAWSMYNITDGRDVDVGGLKLGNYSTNGPCFVGIFHNIFSTMFSSPIGNEATGERGGGLALSTKHHFRNNLFLAQANCIASSGSTNTYDYNVYTSTVSLVVYHWNNNPALDYATVAAFRAATANEANGIEANPQVLDWATGETHATSVARDSGMLLNNINTANSRWPFGGSAPDRGRYEASPGTWDNGNDPYTQTPPRVHRGVRGLRRL